MKNELVEVTIRSLRESPEKWKFGEYSIDYRESSLSIWSTDIFFVGFVRPFKFNISLINKFRVMRAIKQAQQSCLLKIIKGEENDKRT